MRPDGPRALREAGGDRLALGVHGDGQPEGPRAAHPLVQGEVVDPRKVVDAAGAHECLEPDDATGGEFVHRLDAARDEAAPQRHVDERAALQAAPLLVKRSGGHGRRVGVERHLDRRRRTAGGERPRARLKALPIGAAGLVEVHVRVNHPGQEMQAGGVDLVRRGSRQLRTERRDQSVGHADVKQAL